MPTTANRCYSDFLQNGFPWALPYVWSGETGTHILDDDRRVVLSRGDSGIVGYYTGVKAAIYSKRTGHIVSQQFYFNTYMKDRNDSRSDHPSIGFQVIDHCGWDWHVAVPTYPGAFSEAVEEWIETWR